MTIVYEPSRAAALVTAGTENHPLALWDNLIDTYTDDTGTESGGPVENLLSLGTAKYCYPTVNGSGNAIIGFTVTGDVSMICIGSHNLGTIGVTARVQYWDGATWQDSGAGVVSPTDDAAIGWRVDANGATDWRLVIGNATGTQPAIATLFAGAELIFPRPFYQGYSPVIRPNIVDTVTNVSDGGHYLGSSVIRRGGKPSPAAFNNIPASFMRGADFAAFTDHFNAGGLFFFAWRPTKYGDLFIAWRDGPSIETSNSGPQDRMSFRLDMRYHYDP